MDGRPRDHSVAGCQRTKVQVYESFSTRSDSEKRMRILRDGKEAGGPGGSSVPRTATVFGSKLVP